MHPLNFYISELLNNDESIRVINDVSIKMNKNLNYSIQVTPAVSFESFA